MYLETQVIHMPELATIRVDPGIRDDARITKAKLGVTWSEFIDRAAGELDPDEETAD